MEVGLDVSGVLRVQLFSYLMHAGPGHALDTFQVAHFASRNQRHRDTAGPGPARPTDSVEVEQRVVRHLIIHYMRHAVDIQSA